MTRYLLGWQVLLLKRQLWSLQGMVPIAVNVVAQVVLLTSMFASQHDFADSLTMVIVYTSAFAISQITTIYAQALQVTSSGLLGIAPIPARSRVVMAMFAMLVTATLQTFVISLGLCIGLMIRINVLGGLLVGLLTFLATLFLYAGVAAGFIALVTLALPAKYRKVAPALTGLLYFVAMILYVLTKRVYPAAITRFADVFINTAKHGFGPGGESGWLFGAMVFGLGVGTLPMARAYGRILLQTTAPPNTDSRTYESRIVPLGITRIFFWRERIALSRNRALAVLLVIGIVAVLLIPSQFNVFIFVYFGVQMGALILSLGHPKSLALIYASPISPSNLWKSRIIAMLPITSLATVVLLIAGTLHAGTITVGLALTEMLLPFAGLLGVSYALMLNPSMVTTASRRKQSVPKLLISTLLFSFGPLGLGALCSFRPWIGVVVNAGIIFGLWHFGTQFLDTKKSVRYLFQ